MLKKNQISNVSRKNTMEEDRSDKYNWSKCEENNKRTTVGERSRKIGKLPISRFGKFFKENALDDREIRSKHQREIKSKNSNVKARTGSQ
ncbi:hypothetical protein ACWNT8_10515 [Pigmentibacter ruber]|uniref:hypothetical protein n=1 Tax=Pigmentibacter ruber TaxID=2683196 RepID=UPI00131E9D57|nr:hypothetical protein [Pigmentibacter ruber]BFD32276.1 hypothetical protein GTC16762_18940 [Pigmentibacter ruber]